jgi:4-hydroxy-tetrahydrodipicolinate reductase
MAIIKVAINGANGRMGKAIGEVLLKDTQIELVAMLTRNAKPEYNNADVIIDFSSEEGLITLLQNANCKIVSGTTGLSQETFQMMKKYGEEKNGIIWGSNTSFGVNLMFAMVKKLGAALHANEYDAEVYERHHRMKKDAPSGTALTIGKKIAEGRGVEFVKNDYSSFGERKTGEIGFAIERGGKTVGFHEARFISDDETIWFGHEAHDRSIFAKGAVKLAKIAVERDVKGYKEAWEVLTDFI